MRSGRPSWPVTSCWRSTSTAWPPSNARTARSGGSRVPPGDWIMRWHRDGDVVYVDGEFPSVRARAFADGAERWRYEAEDADYATWFAIDDDRMYVQERGDAITALDTADGSVAWRRSLPVPDDRHVDNFLAAKAPGSDLLYLLTREDDILALDATDGSRQWRADATVDNDGPRNRFVHLGSGLYLLVWDYEDRKPQRTVVHRLDGGDGGPRWSQGVDDDVATLSLPAEDYLLANARHSVLALDPQTGEHRWPQSVREDLAGAPYEVVDGRGHHTRSSTA
ncbi:hypothetical protein BRC81_08000 [Halobacteriales archaeon QS_1_68_20]|nr:MAG: hypothetical protein BRC81_08000 [Halobacteriales archaeon QS_1_68_20]